MTMVPPGDFGSWMRKNFMLGVAPLCGGRG